MASDYKQNNRPMTVSTPLGPDVLLLVSFDGSEEMSTLFSYRLELIAKAGTKIAFDQLLGEPMLVTMRILDEKAGSGGSGGVPKVRYFSGICRQFAQGNSDEHFTSYQAEIVPQVWLTTRIARSRIFQQMSVPEILKKVLKGFKMEYQLDGKFEKRDYCVQYRETDFNFVSRLMEEEGIFYFFKHTHSGHEMVVANSQRVHPDTPDVVKVRWDCEEGANREQNHVFEWVKRQEVRSGKFTVWDHSFELPGNSLDATKTTLESIQVGKVTQKLHVANNKQLEIYDYPGEYAKWFDGVDKAGNDAPAELKKIFQENARTAGIRMEAETCAGLRIHGSSNCTHFVTGHKFNLERHPDAEGNYVLTSIHHHASGGNSYRSGGEEPFVYSNTFTCIPVALAFRPQRTTPKPAISGVQTATVVGPDGKEIYVDKHARVKVQFPWDREGQHDADSSCWIRVSQAWGGGGFGGMAIPRIGHEVIVDFVEGDPDRPIITGRVYNARNMPHSSNAGRDGKAGNKKPSGVPDAAMMTSFKSNSLGGSGGHNEITMNDEGGKEGLFLKAQKDEIHNVGNDREDSVGNNETRSVKVDRKREVGNNENVKIGVNREKSVGVDEKITIGANQTVDVGVNQTISVGVNRGITVGVNESKTINVCRLLTTMLANNDLAGVMRGIETGVFRFDMTGLAMADIVGLARATVTGLVDFQLTGMNRYERVGVDYALKAGSNVTVKASADHIVEAGANAGLKAGAMVVIESKDITLKAPGGFIRIDGSGVTIQGTKVKVNSGGSYGSLPGADAAGGAAAGKGGGPGGGGGPGSAASVPGAGAGGLQTDFAKFLQKLGVPEKYLKVLDGLLTDPFNIPFEDLKEIAPTMEELLKHIPKDLLPEKLRGPLGDMLRLLRTELSPDDTDERKKANAADQKAALESLANRGKDAANEFAKQHGVNLENPTGGDKGDGKEGGNGAGGTPAPAGGGQGGSGSGGSVSHLADPSSTPSGEDDAPASTPTNAAELSSLAEDEGFTVTSTTGGGHNPGSAHYEGRAIDVRTRDKTDAEIQAFIQKARARGITVIDERTRPPGQEVWGGPHLHLQVPPA